MQGFIFFIPLQKILITMKHNILIVEDDASFGVMLQTWLKKNGYEAVLATRYAQAKKEISSQGFDLIRPTSGCPTVTVSC